MFLFSYLGGGELQRICFKKSAYVKRKKSASNSVQDRLKRELLKGQTIGICRVAFAKFLFNSFF
jgi:hypothetical protein